MTHPLTPREKVAALKTNDPTNPAHRLAGDLQAGHFALGESRDDLIEVLSNLPRYAALASGSGDHAELATDIRKLCVGHPHARIAWPHYELHALADRAEALLAENAALRASVVKANDGFEEYERRFYLEQDRATEAERKLAGAEAEIRRWKSAHDIAHDRATENGSAANALRGKLAEAVGLLREWMGAWFVDADSRGENAIADDTRKFLSKEAERG